MQELKSKLIDGGIHKRFLMAILFLQLLTDVVVFLNITYFRQIIGFVYLAFVPGMALLMLFRIRNLDITEFVLFSLGLSIAFLMFLGLLINESYPLIGISFPLSTDSIIASLNLVVLPLSLLGYFLDRNLNVPKASLDLTPLHTLAILLFICLPVLSVFGSFMMNAFVDNSFLLLMIVIASFVVLLASLSEKIIPSKFYPIALLAIYISITLHEWLVTNYLIGWDSHFEFQVFELTREASHWNPSPSFVEIDKGNVMLSVTILPTIYSKILNLDATWVLKIVYPIILSFLSLGLYKLYCTQTEKKTAFLATFFFISNVALGLGSIKQWIAYLFYALLFLVFFTKKMPSFKRNMFFIIFGAALVTSHYAMSYIFLFIIFLTWAFSILSRNISRISTRLVALFSTLTFSWYIYTVGSVAFDELLRVGDFVFRNIFEDLLNPQARGTMVLSGLGLTEAASPIHQIGRIFFYISEFLIIVGLVTLIVKRKRMNFDREYVLIACLNMAILLLNIIVPNLASTFLMGRFYKTSLVILAPICIVGGKTVLELVSKTKVGRVRIEKYWAIVLTLTLLAPLLLFQTGFVYEITGVRSWSIPLSRYRIPDYELYNTLVDEQEVFGARWLAKGIDIEGTLVYADSISRSHVLTSYGMISWEHMRVLTNTTRNLNVENFVYLRQLNVINGIMIGQSLDQWDTREIVPILDDQDKIYSNGGCDIYEGAMFQNKTVPS